MVAAKILAKAAAYDGLQVQAFSAYGAERRGGRVDSFIRISHEKIRLHTKMYAPDIVALFDGNLAGDPSTTSDIKPGGKILINSTGLPSAWEADTARECFAVDAVAIAGAHGVVLPNGVPVINTTMLGALVALLPVLKADSLYEAIRSSGIAKAEDNVRAALTAYQSLGSEASPQLDAPAEDDPAPSPGRPLFTDDFSPCQRDCPAGQDIRSMIRLVQEGRFSEALTSLRQENPFPGVCGRVCFRPCQGQCNAGHMGDSITIGNLERAAFDFADGAEASYPQVQPANGRKVAVIGSGPAGMAASYYLCLMGYQVTVLEASTLTGGIPRQAIPSYRLPSQVIEQEMDSIIALGVEVRSGVRVGRDISLSQLNQDYDACLVACGAHRSRPLEIPGIDCQGVSTALAFLKGIALGEEVAVGQRVAVIGGGNTAVDAARSAKRLGAESVTIIYRRSLEEMPAYQEEVREAMAEGVEVLPHTLPTSVESSEGALTGLNLADTRPGPPDPDGRRRPELVEGSEAFWPFDQLLTALGEAVDDSFLPPEVARDGDLIAVDWLGRTSLAGVLAAGDAVSWDRTVTHAIGSGKRAAVGIDLFLSRRDPREAGLPSDQQGPEILSLSRYLAGAPQAAHPRIITVQDLNTNYLNFAPCQEPPAVYPEESRLSFVQACPGLSDLQAIDEARRCFLCGRCNLCGNCFVFCPDGAVQLSQDGLGMSADYALCKSCGICHQECSRGVVALEGVRP